MKQKQVLVIILLLFITGMLFANNEKKIMKTLNDVIKYNKTENWPKLYPLIAGSAGLDAVVNAAIDKNIKHYEDIKRISESLDSIESLFSEFESDDDTDKKDDKKNDDVNRYEKKIEDLKKMKRLSGLDLMIAYMNYFTDPQAYLLPFNGAMSEYTIQKTTITGDKAVMTIECEVDENVMVLKEFIADLKEEAGESVSTENNEAERTILFVNEKGQWKLETILISDEFTEASYDGDTVIPAENVEKLFDLDE